MRDWRLSGLENFGTFQPFPNAGRFEIPQIFPVQLPEIKEWKGFNYARAGEVSGNVGVHFFVDDYQFAVVWNDPIRYMERFKGFGAVLSPDFSTYSDMPQALQIYNHYRKHWCAQYWQSNGVTVIPTISWSTPESWEWCFDGEPVGGVVAVSTVGCERDKEAFGLFVSGYQEMLRRLDPSQIIVYGKRFDFMTESNITVIEPFLKQMKERAMNNGRQREQQRG